MTSSTSLTSPTSLTRPTSLARMLTRCRMTRTARRVLATGALLAACAGVLPGCYQYANYPAIPTSTGMLEDPNRPATMQAMVSAVSYVATRYPPAANIYDLDPTTDEAKSVRVTYPMVFNAPRGLRRIYYSNAADLIGPQVVPMTPDAAASGLPVFHVTRVWMRGNQATIDVLRPMPELGKDPQGRTVYQPVTVRLEGGFQPWRVVHARIWNPGDEIEPAPYFLPEVDRADEFDRMRALDRGETLPEGE